MITEVASEQLAAIDARDRETGDRWYEVIYGEMLQKLALLEHHPELGHAFPRFEGDRTRRIYMPKSRHHLYYEYDEAKDTILVKSVWYSSRGELPPVE